MNKKINDTALALIMTGIIAVLTCFSPEAKKGAARGIQLSEGVIIPSLLPVLMMTNIMLKSRASRFFERVFGAVFEKVLRLPRAASVPVVFGLAAGYPSGAVLTVEQYRDSNVSKSTAQRIMCFNTCGGLAFIISAVGGYYGSTAIGALLYIINIISDIIIAVITGFLYDSDTDGKESSAPLPFSSALSKSAETSSKSVILMSAYIILFCAVTNIIKLPDFLTPLLEITSGIFGAESKIPLPYCAAFLAFGGLCIHLQLMGMLSEIGLKYSRYFIFRVLSAVLSFVLCKAYLYLFPQTAEVFYSAAENVSYQFTEVNTALGIIAMLGCAMIIVEIENKKIRL